MLAIAQFIKQNKLQKAEGEEPIANSEEP